jgi:hypothetical protein
MGSTEVTTLPKWALTEVQNAVTFYLHMTRYMRMYPKVSGLAAWSENCKWYSPLPLDAVVSLFCESV